MKMLRILVGNAWLLSVVAASLLLAGGAFGQASICSPGGDGDFDGDGFSDFLECQGFSMLPGLQVEVLDSTGTVVNSTFLPSCFGLENPDRRYCASAEQSDLFVIVVAANPTTLPPGPLETAARPISEGGLGLNVHMLSEDSANPGTRQVSAASGQKALRIREDLDPNGEILGQANYGTPNDIDRATIWTTRIAAFVAATCSSDAPCVTTTGADGIAEVSDALARWVIEHEVGHTFRLSADYNKRFGGFHLKAGTDSIMAQFISYSTRKKGDGRTTFFIPQTFDAQSQADALLDIP